MTLHHFIALNFEVERETTVKINLTPEEIEKKYGGNLQPQVEGKLYDVLSTLFNNLVKIKKIIVPGEFKSNRGAKAIKCSVRAAEGFLYPLKSSIVFIHKPVLYIRHSEIKWVEFSRVGQGAANLTRSFDVTFTKAKDDSTHTFLSIDKEEQQVLMAYFKQSNIKIKIMNEGGPAGMEMSDSDDGGARGKEDSRGNDKRQIKKKAIDPNEELDDDESDDESFNSGD